MTLSAPVVLPAKDEATALGDVLAPLRRALPHAEVGRVAEQITSMPHGRSQRS